MSEHESGDRQSLIVVVMILAVVMAFGIIAAGIAMWTMLGRTRTAQREAELAQHLALEAQRRASLGTSSGDVVLFLVDGLRAEHVEDPARSLPLFDELIAAGASAEVIHTRSTGTTAAVASFLVPPTWWGRDLGLISPRDIGFHRLPESVPTRAVEMRAFGYATSGFASAEALQASLTGLNRGFDHWDAPGTKRDFRAVIESAETFLSARDIAVPSFVMLQLELGDEPDPSRVVELLRSRSAELGEERAAVEEALDQTFETDAQRLKAVEAVVGRRRGSAGWMAWRRARYDALTAEFDAEARELLQLFGEDARVLVAGTRGQLVTEPRPAPEREGFSDSRVRVPLVVLGELRRPVIELPSVVVSPEKGSFAKSDELEKQSPFVQHVGLRSPAGLTATLRLVGQPRLRSRLDDARSTWHFGALMLMEHPRAALRLDLGPWGESVFDDLGVVRAVEDQLRFQAQADSDAPAVPLREVAWPWIADARGSDWQDGEDWVLDVSRDRTLWSLSLADSHVGDVVVHLAAYPLTNTAPALELKNVTNLAGPLPGAAVFRVSPGQRVEVPLSPGQSLALRASDLDGRALSPDGVRYEGRQLFTEEASFLVPSWWAGRPDWFAEGASPTSAKPWSEFGEALMLLAPAGAEGIDGRAPPTLMGPLGLTAEDVELLHRLPSDA